MFNLFIFIVVIAGAINWFCIGIFQFDIIAGVFGSQAHFISRFIYGIIGLAGIYLAIVASIKRGHFSLGNNAYKKCSTKEEAQPKVFKAYPSRPKLKIKNKQYNHNQAISNNTQQITDESNKSRRISKNKTKVSQGVYKEQLNKDDEPLPTRSDNAP